MYFTKKFNINRRIIRYNDVLEIARFFETLSSEQSGKCTFTIDFRDKTSIRGNGLQIFESTDFKRKDCIHIQFEYSNIHNLNYIDLCLEETCILPFATSGFAIRSTDEMWLNALYIKLRELIDGISKRSIFRKAFSLPWVLITYVFAQVLFWKLMPLFGMGFGSRPLLADGTPDPNVQFIPAGLFFLFRVICFSIVAFCISYLYPEQEFAFGGLHYSHRVRMRKVIGWILSTIIIPIVLSSFF